MPELPKLVGSLLLCCSLAGFWPAAGAARAQIVDRVLAVVGGELVLLSDLTAALRFGLVDVPDGEDRMRVALDVLVERQLQVTEVNRYLPPEPPEAAIEARLAAMRARFDGPEAWEGALAESGMTLEHLRGLVREDLRVASYREQRFGAAFQPTEEDVARYYRDHQARFTRGGTLRPFTDVRDEARQLLIAERTATLTRDWIDGLRRRAIVTVLP